MNTGKAIFIGLTFVALALSGPAFAKTDDNFSVWVLDVKRGENIVGIQRP
jgi:hypothetical protein